MFRRRRSNYSTYQRSQAVLQLSAPPSSTASEIAGQLISADNRASHRERLSQQLVDELNSNLGLTDCKVTVADRAQVHRHDGQRLQSKTYGYYRCEFAQNQVIKARIRIYHRTAVRQQIISPKVFLNTLLHEWVHHYDFDKLKLPYSPHTAGFYQRLRHLADSLKVSQILPPEPETVNPTGSVQG